MPTPQPEKRAHSVELGPDHHVGYGHRAIALAQLPTPDWQRAMADMDQHDRTTRLMTATRGAEASADGTMQPSLTDGDANHRPDRSNTIIELDRRYYGCVMESSSDDVDPNTTPKRGRPAPQRAGGTGPVLCWWFVRRL